MLKFRNTAIVLVLSVFFISGCGKKATEVEINENTPIHIKYDLDGKGKFKASIELNYKDKNLKVESISTGEQAINEIKIVKDKTFYIINDVEGKKTGYKMALQTDMISNELAYTINVKDKIKEMKKTGTGDVLGFTCDIYESEKEGKMTVYVYKDMIMMKVMSDDVEWNATLFEPGASIPDKTFDVPTDIEFKDESSAHDKMQTR